MVVISAVFFFFQAEDGIRDKLVTGVQTCALPISKSLCCQSLPVTPVSVQPYVPKGTKTGVNGTLLHPTATRWRRGLEFGVSDKWHQAQGLGSAETVSIVQDGSQNGNGEMRQRRGPFIELYPTYGAMIFQILGDARLADPQVFGKTGAEWLSALFGASLPTQKIPYAHAQRLAGLNVVVGSQVGIGQNEDARACGSLVSLIEPVKRAGK